MDPKHDRTRTVGGIAAVVCALLVNSCGAGNTGPGQGFDELLPGGISSNVRSAFDSASAAFVAGNPRLASELFSAALAEDSTLAAAWIGLYLAERAMGHMGQNDSVLARARSLMEPPPRPRGRGAAGPGT